MRLTAACLAEWAKGRLVACDPLREVTGISADSRSIAAGQAFVALKGLRFDGHEFAAEALQKGASLAIVQRPEPLGNRPGIIVADTLQALGEIAHRYRWQQPLIPWVAVTGSNGKTTTRSMIAHLLRSRGAVAEPRANFNNAVGLPLTILERPDDAWAGVLEIGTNAPGEVAYLTRIAMPTIAVVTSIGPAHLENFGTLEAIAHEKGAIFERLPNDGLAIYPAQCLCNHILAGKVRVARATFGLDKPADLVAERITSTAEGIAFQVRGVCFRLRLLGRHNVLNCLAALLVGQRLGIAIKDAASVLEDFTAAGGRLERIAGDSVVILNDSYNANPASLQAAIEVLESWPAARRIAIIGDMLELGIASRQMHREAGRAMGQRKLDAVITVGREAVALAEGASSVNARLLVRHFPNVKSLLLAIDDLLADGDVILVKGSRGMHMEDVVRALKIWQPPERGAI